MSPLRVLVVEDDAALRHAIGDAIGETLRAQGLQLEECTNGADALRVASASTPALVILDLGLPDMDGREVCVQLRRWSAVPILVVSARESEAEKVALLDHGADDYIVKPFGVAELVARVQALLRRAALSGPGLQTPRLQAEHVLVDIAARKVVRDGDAVRLTPIEWALLEALASAAGRTLTHQQLFDRVWNRQFGSPKQYLRVYMTHLRRKIEPDPPPPGGS